MNNSKIALDNSSEENDGSILQKKQGELAQIVEALNRVEANEDWQKLKSLVLDGVVVALERQLKNEASKDEVNAPELYRLQGQLVWAKKYANLGKFAEFFKAQLVNIKNQINAQNPADGAA